MSVLLIALPGSIVRFCDAVRPSHHDESIEDVQISSESKSRSLWDVFDKAAGVKHNDIVQGHVSTCYFLAAIASIAHMQPHVIERMFTQQEFWKPTPGSRPVFITEWLIHGKKITVAVDDMVPADSTLKKPFFATVPFFKHGRGAHIWPIVLEKAWAKIYGSFEKIEWGFQHEAFKAITQAPVDVVHLEDVEQEVVFKTLLTASQRKFPMIAGSYGSETCKIVQNKHAFVVLGAEDGASKFSIADVPALSHYTATKLVHMYNPHGSNQYTGNISGQSRSDGHFFMTFLEFLACFSSVTVAKVSKNYVVSPHPVYLSRTGPTYTVLEFTMTSNAPFSVQLEWPNSRLVPRRCKILEPNFAMVVAKDGPVFGNGVFATKSSAHMTNARADMEGGAGNYIVYVFVEFVGTDWLEEVVVNTYAPETVEIKKRHDLVPADVFLQMCGLCHGKMKLGSTEYEVINETFLGAPVFRSSKDGDIVFNAMQYYLRQFSTEITGDNKWYQVPSVAKFSKQSIFCGEVERNAISCNHSGLEVLVEVGSDYVVDDPSDGATCTKKASKEVEKHVDQSGVEYGMLVTCDAMVKRLGRLGNWEQIRSGKDDVEFPADLSSIGPPDARWGNYNHWESFADMLRQEGDYKHVDDGDINASLASNLKESGYSDIGEDVRARKTQPQKDPEEGIWDYLLSNGDAGSGQYLSFSLSKIDGGSLKFVEGHTKGILKAGREKPKIWFTGQLFQWSSPLCVIRVQLRGKNNMVLNKKAPNASWGGDIVAEKRVDAPPEYIGMWSRKGIYAPFILTRGLRGSLQYHEPGGFNATLAPANAGIERWYIGELIDEEDGPIGTFIRLKYRENRKDIVSSTKDPGSDWGPVFEAERE